MQFSFSTFPIQKNCLDNARNFSTGWGLHIWQNGSRHVIYYPSIGFMGETNCP